MKTKLIGPVILIALGLHFSLQEFFNISLFGFINIGKIWPLLLLAFGIFKLWEISTNNKK